jgi:hypothetical protein
MAISPSSSEPSARRLCAAATFKILLAFFGSRADAMQNGHGDHAHHLCATSMPRTPSEVRDLNTRTASTGKRIALPCAGGEQHMRRVRRRNLTPTSASSSSSLMAILPDLLMRLKSDRSLRRTPPDRGREHNMKRYPTPLRLRAWA